MLNVDLLLLLSFNIGDAGVDRPPQLLHGSQAGKGGGRGKGQPCAATGTRRRRHHHRHQHTPPPNRPLPPPRAASCQLLHDLDLLVTDEAGLDTYHPNGLPGPDEKNNVEKVVINHPEPQVRRTGIGTVYTHRRKRIQCAVSL